jgi:competence protein ComEC
MREEVAPHLAAGSGSAQTQRLDLDISSAEFVTDEEDTQRAMPGGVRLTVRWPDGEAPASGFHCGERVRADARLLQPEVYRDPGAWNRRDYLLDQGIYWTGAG